MENKVVRPENILESIIKEVRHRTTWSYGDLGINPSARRRFFVKEAVNKLLDTLPVDDNIQITINPIDSKYAIEFVDVTAHYFDEIKGE